MSIKKNLSPCRRILIMTEGDQSKAHILFTGAGFSKNFGLPLAIEVWADLFNSKIIREDKRLCQLFHQNESYQNYEIIYDRIKKQYPDLKDKSYRLFHGYFRSMDDKIIRYFNSKRNISNSKLFDFINRFDGFKGSLEESADIFTLNQDLFIERIYINFSSQSEITTPYVEKLSLSENNKYKKMTELTSYHQIKEIEIPDSFGDFKINRFKTIYLKLHGSCNWYRKEDTNERILLIGKDKTNDVESVPLLKKYFEILENVLKTSPKICCIGYSFNDEHVNSLFVKYDVDLFIIGPSRPDKFFKDMIDSDNCNKKTIWEHRINHYYQAELSDLFPIYGKSDVYERFKGDFWGDI